MVPMPSPSQPGAPDGSSEDLLELLARTRSGDPDARERLFATCYPRVLSIVRSRLGGGLRRFHESGDVVQEALLLAARDLERIEVRDEAALLSWLAKVVENRLRDMAKFHAAAKREAGRERREASLVGDEDDGLVADAVDSADATPSQVFAGSEERERLARAMAGLDPKRRRVIELRSAGAPWAEVARELGLASDGAARMLHARTLVELGRALEETGDDGAPA